MQFGDGYVYFWTDKAQRKSQPPLVLRLITIHTGKHPIYLVTNDLEIEDEEVRTIYRQRWGIEVFFRTVKQSAQRRQLSCLTPQNVLTELQWTLLGPSELYNIYAGFCCENAVAVVASKHIKSKYFFIKTG